MIKRVDKFRYLGSLLQCEDGVTEEVGARIQAGWLEQLEECVWSGVR